jgi:multiple sugar transport system permease protein
MSATAGEAVRAGSAAPSKPPRLRPRAREALAGYLFISPWILGFLVFTAGAMLASLGISMLKTDFLTHAEFTGLNQFKYIFEDPRHLTQKALINTAYYSFAMVPLGTSFALGIAVLLNQGIKGQSIWRLVYYLPSIVSGVAVSILWAWLYSPDLGLINAMLWEVGFYPHILSQPIRWIYSETWAMPSLIIMAVWGSGGSMLIFLAGLRNIPTSLYEAAEIDGATSWQRFWSITIPMLSPTIFFSIVMRIIGSFQVFAQAFVMTQGGPNNATLTMVLYIYRKAFEQLHFGYASALAWVLFAIILLLTLVAVRSSDSWVFYAGEGM